MATRRQIRYRLIILTALFVVTVYVAISFFVYAFRYPHLTQTQLFLSFWDVLLWR